MNEKMFKFRETKILRDIDNTTRVLTHSQTLTNEVYTFTNTYKRSLLEGATENETFSIFITLNLNLVHWMCVISLNLLQINF